MTRAVVCVPTYEERENLEPLVRALAEVLDTSRDRVLVIDDGSPDGTGRSPTASPRSCPGSTSSTAPARRASGGRTSPGSRGCSRLDAELVLEMDCDFSHDPGDVPRLIAACEEGADLALGSRWVEGGGTVNWGLLRRLISRGGSLYARLVLGVGVRDLTGGFKCFRRVVLETIDRDAIAARGYGFQIEGTYRALRKGFRSSRCRSRSSTAASGESKMSGAIVVEAMRQVPVLRWQALRGRL